MQTSAIGLELIKKFEGFSSVPYRCPAEKLTIGYGHVIVLGDKFPESGITELTAINILKQDVIVAEKAITHLVTVPLLQHQFDAMVSFVYNVGEKSFEKSTLLRLINESNLELAAKEFSRWIYAGGTVQKGLVARRMAEKELFTGIYGSSIK